MFRRLAEEGAAATRESLAKAGPLDLVEESRRAFADFAPDIAGAAVFLDDGAAETVHYACGASFLLGLGAKNVFALPAASAATTTERFPDDRTNSTTVRKIGESSNDRDPERGSPGSSSRSPSRRRRRSPPERHALGDLHAQVTEKRRD
jgi:hypothetical protein